MFSLRDETWTQKGLFKTGLWPMKEPSLKNWISAGGKEENFFYSFLK